MNRIDLLNRDEFVENVIKIVNVLSENEEEFRETELYQKIYSYQESNKVHFVS